MIVDHLIKYQEYHILQICGKAIKNQMLQALMREDESWFIDTAVRLSRPFSYFEYLTSAELYEQIARNYDDKDFFPISGDLHNAIQGLNDLFTLRYLGELAGEALVSENKYILDEKTKNHWNCLIKHYNVIALKQFLKSLHEELEQLFNETIKSFRSDRCCQLRTGLSCLQILDKDYPNPCDEWGDKTKWDEECQRAIDYLPNYAMLLYCLNEYKN